MVGYGLKDAKEEHFKVVDVNVFDVKKNANIDEYKKFNAISTKNHVVLSNVNIIDKAFAWVQVLSKKTCSTYVIGHESIQPILSSSCVGCAFKARRHGFHWGTFNLEMHGNAFSSFYG
jgi:hypothetical protein